MSDSGHYTIKTCYGFTLFKKPNSSFWNIRFTLAGQSQFRQSLKTSDQDEAMRLGLKLYYEITAKIDAGLNYKAKTTNDVIDEWLSRETLRQPELSVVNLFIRGYFGKMDVSKITHKTVSDFMKWRISYWTEGPGKDVDYVTYTRNGKLVKRPVEHKEPQPSTLHTLEAILSKFFRFCVRNAYMKSVPDFQKTKVKSGKRPSFTREEVLKIQNLTLLDYTQALESKKALRIYDIHQTGVLYAFVSIMAETGMRPTECLRLKWTDIEEFNPYPTTTPKQRERDVVKIKVHGKNKHRTLICFESTRVAFSMLWEVYEHTLERPIVKEDYVWLHMNGSIYKDVTRLLLAFLKKHKMIFDYMGEKRDAYSFRHYYITKMLSDDVNIHHIARNCGTSVAMIEKHYSHVSIEAIADHLRVKSNRL